MIPSLKGWPTKAKEAPYPHEVRMSSMDTNPVFQNLGGENTKSNRNLWQSITHLKLEKHTTISECMTPRGTQSTQK